MNKTTILLTICLLLTAPYILGGENADYHGSEAEIPSLKVPTTYKRKWYTVTDSEQMKKAVEKAAQQAYLQTPEGKAELAELRKKISLRKQRLLLKGDVELMMHARIQDGVFHSVLPLSVNAFQGPRSLLAYFVKEIIVASGLSKTEAKKIVKTMFPSQGMVKREARRQGEPFDTVRNEYAMRQMTLHAYLHSVASSQELRATVEEKIRFHTEGAEQAQQKLDELGGYISIADATKKNQQDVKLILQDYKDTLNSKKSHFEEVEDKLMKWVATPGLVTEATWQEFDIDISKGKAQKLLNYQGKAKMRLYKDVLMPNITSAINKVNRMLQEDPRLISNGQLEQEAPKVYAKLRQQEENFATLKAEHSVLPATVTYKNLNRHLKLQDHFEQVSESWKHWDVTNLGETQAWSCADKSENFVKARFIDMRLTDSEVFDSLPLLHHPTMIWPQSLSPEWLANTMGQSITDDESFITISRKSQKPSFKGGWDAAGITNMRELSKAFGLPTRTEDESGTHKLSAKELRTQWKSSSLQLSLPTGVLAELGQEFNDLFDEADFYRQRWGSSTVYDWRALPVEEAEQLEAEKKLDELLAGFF